MVLGLQNYLRTVIIYLSHAPVSACFISWHDLLVWVWGWFFFFGRVLFKLAFFGHQLHFEIVEILIQYCFNPYLCYNYSIFPRNFCISAYKENDLILSLFQFAVVGRKLTCIHWPCSLGYLNSITLNFKGNLFTSFPSPTFKIVLPVFYLKCLQTGKVTCLNVHLVTWTKWPSVYPLLDVTIVRYLWKRHTA